MAGTAKLFLRVTDKAKWIRKCCGIRNYKAKLSNRAERNAAISGMEHYLLFWERRQRRLRALQSHRRDAAEYDQDSRVAAGI